MGQQQSTGTQQQSNTGRQQINTFALRRIQK